MPDKTFHFGVFEVNAASGELRKNGTRIKVQEQPFQILVLLLNRPGEIVGREEIRSRLWPDNTFVDFDNAISSAVRKLREALNDNADTPRFIETVARRGYRFVGQTAAQQAPAAATPDGKRIKLFAIAAGALLVLGVTGWWLLSRPKPENVPLNPTPLTAAHGWESHPSFSPDGNQVVYGWRASEAGNGASHIYVKLVGPGAPVQLTANSKSDVFPAWSPDGSKIAFERSRDDGHASTIYLIPPVGGSERKLVDGYFYGPFYWSPDSRFLVGGDRMSQNGVSSIYLVNVENGEKMRMTTPPDEKTMDTGALFSPDGRTLLFHRCEILTCSLYLLDLSSDYRPRGAPRLLRKENGDIRGAAWTTDGKDIIYVLSNDGQSDYHLMRIAARNHASPERLSYAGEQLYMGVAVSARGDRLAYVKNLYDSDIAQIQAGGSPHAFVASTRLELYPQYSPDGKRVVFCSDRSGQTEIWVSDAQGNNPEQLTNFEEGACTPRWSPDGRWITFDRHMKQGFHIFVMAADGGQVRQLNTDVGHQVIPNWSQDGNWIYYAASRTGRFEIWKAPAKGGNGIQVTRNGGWVAFESIDGKALYYTKNLDNSNYVSQLWTIPVGGGEERTVLESSSSRAFAVMKDGIYYVLPPFASDNRASIRFYDFTTGKSSDIASISNFDRGFTVSPDGKTFLFTVQRRSEANIMIVDNFR
ncbi:MAG TPA: winged helix-turn-helix domain-containing protein [Bryobacteraceae bacterium]|jgi:Tol biopolymer transport system component/DNA-binding winged helix-turn-helix (wHTH) protein